MSAQTLSGRELGIPLIRSLFNLIFMIYSMSHRDLRFGYVGSDLGLLLH